MTTVAIEIDGIDKSFKRGDRVLKDVSLTIAKGEMVALIGASGSGKSTLIRSIAGLIDVDGPAQSRTGEIRVLGQTMQSGGRVVASAKGLRSRLSIVFQQFNLVPRLSVLTNVLVGTLGSVPRWRGTIGRFKRAEKQRAMQALARVGIPEQALKRGSQLSGGQQQRAAIARCLMQGAEILIADEPIASLDPSSARRIMDILADLNQRDGITVLVSLHQVEYALCYCPRTIALRQGEVVYDGPSEALTPQFLCELYGAEGEELFLPGIEAAGRETSKSSTRAQAAPQFSAPEAAAGLRHARPQGRKPPLEARAG
ncbi:MAG: phosphonate ABC transporter ATP-binding protein [Hyphomicrobiaceae bacterium]